MAAEQATTPTVLIIEDDKRLLRALSYFLRQKGLQVYEATDGESGLELYRSARPNILVVDNSLPNMMGYEVCREVRAGGGMETPIIMISAYMKVLGADGQQGDEDKLVDRFLRKPFQLEQLWSAIASMRALDGFARPRLAIEEPAAPPEPTDDDAPLPSDGSCADVPFIDMLGRALVSQTTGILTLREDNRVRRLYLANGFPVFARSNLITENLLRYLLRIGEIDADTYRRHLSRMQQERWRPGATLVREGAISLTRLNHSHRLLVEDIIETCINWHNAAFEFRASQVPVEQAVVYDINPFRLVDRWLEHSFGSAQLLNRIQLIVHGTVAPSAHFENWRHLVEWAFTLDTELERALGRGRPCVELMDIPTEQRPLRARLLQTLLLMRALQLSDPQARLRRPATDLVHALMRPPVEAEADTEESGANSKFGRSAAPVEARPRVASPAPVVPQPPPSVPLAPVDDGQRSHEQLRRIYDVVLRDYHRILDGSSPYEVLRVSRNDSLDVIRRRYERFEKFYRPENFQRLGDSKLYQLAIEIRQALARSMAEIESGISSLGGSRATGDSSFVRSLSWADPLGGSDPLAQIFFNDGLTYLRIGEFREADQHFTRAVEREPANGMYQAYIVWTNFLEANRSPEAAQFARESLERLIEMHPQEDTCYHFLAHIYREDGDLERAVDYYRKAAELNPDNRSARLFLQRLAVDSP